MYLEAKYCFLQMVPPVKKEMHIEVIRIRLAVEEAGRCSAFLNGYVRKVEFELIREWVKTTGSERQRVWLNGSLMALSMILSLKAFENGKIILLRFPYCFVFLFLFFF